MTIQKFQNKQEDNFNLVNPSPWPLLGSSGVLMFTFGCVLYMQGFSGLLLMEHGLLMTFFTMSSWWRDVVREGTYEGQHTASVQWGLKTGMILFIVSEVMFFFGIFWSFFHSSFNPSVSIGGVWPPAFLITLDPWKIPYFNTVLLITSGATTTWGHHALLFGDKKKGLLGLVLTLALGLVFLYSQALEFLGSPFSISDGVYTSTFFMATGFHGFHVFCGFVFLVACTTRLYFNHYTREHHIGFEAAAWYWHFVDVVWLFLFLTVYWWGA
jgi:cytochrome c oxidase subunit 3